MLKRWPRLFDATRGVARRFGYRPPVYQFLQRVADRLPALTFVQCGANDGMSTDPIREFVLANRGWNGIFIEPLPGLFARLRRNYRYAARPGLEFLQVAVSGQPGTGTVWKIRDDCYRHYPISARGMASFSKTNLTKHFPDRAGTIDAELEAVEVPCLTYDQIVARYALPKVDLLVMDIEGHEPAVLASTPLVGPTAPRIVLYEVDHIPPAEQTALVKRFRDNGYHFRSLEQDGVAVCDELRELVNY
jgi:FkbM family methyltransferase